MNASIRSEEIDSTTEEVDSNLAAVSEVEAGIRDFVRNDIAYLRRARQTRARKRRRSSRTPRPPSTTSIR